MAHVCTTRFSYKGKDYSAVVYQIDGSLSIFLPDDSLHDLIPGGRVSLDISRGFEIDKTGLSPAQDLILCVLLSLTQIKNPEGQNKGVNL